jgi:acetoin utilization deacetylase AcuC-like enzyme
MVNSAIQLFYSDRNPLPLPANHHFPAPKVPLLIDRLSAAEFDGRFILIAAPAARDEQLLLVHTPDYLNRMVLGQMSEKEMRRTGFPWSAELVERSRRSVGATISASRSSLETGLSANLGGGTHHAFPDHGEGYCVFNDVAIAIRVLQFERRVTRVVILDCDVHQGNGTAAIFAGDPQVFTFSIHGSKNFPFKKQNSDLDIELPDGCGDGEYLTSLEKGLEKSLAGAPADLAFYIAGADPYEGDRLGRLAITQQGLARRDRLVFEHCSRLGIPVTVVMGGGYARNLSDIVEIHLQTLLIAVEFAPLLRQSIRNKQPFLI